MNELVINKTGVELSTNENRVYANTRDIAEVFGKEHSKVIRAVENIVTDEDFTEAKIGLSEYKDKSGKVNKMYNLDRDMFSLIVMGFTGKKAIEWKRMYIKAFNTMEEKIISTQLLIKDREIAKLRLEKKMCMITDDGYSTVRGIAQRSDYSEKEIREFIKEHGLVEPKVKATRYWKVCDDADELIVKADKNGTPYIHVEAIVELMDEVAEEDGTQIIVK